jgi:hypothetical protein
LVKKSKPSRPPHLVPAPIGHNQPPSPLPPPQSKRVLDYDGLKAKGVRYHPNHLRRLWERGDFPRPFKPTPHRLAWFEDVIDTWLAEKARASASDQR